MSPDFNGQGKWFLSVYDTNIKIIYIIKKMGDDISLSYFIKITKNNQYTPSHYKLLKIQLS